MEIGLYFREALTMVLLKELCMVKVLAQLVVVVVVASEMRKAHFSKTGMCSTDAPYAVKNCNRVRCASECLHMETCHDFNYKNDNSECALFLHKPLFYDTIPGCAEFKASIQLFYNYC